MEYQLDEIDKRILYYFAQDARNTTAREIAEEVSVSPGTIGNRIDNLEDRGVLEGYHASIDYEEAEDLLTRLYICNTPSEERERLTREVLEIPGVVNVRRTMIGRGDLHVVAVGNIEQDTGRIRTALAELNLEIEQEGLLEEERFHPYHPYGPSEVDDYPSKDYLDLDGEAEVMNFRLSEEASVVGMTIKEAAEEDIVPDDVLIVTIDRDGSSISPTGDTRLQEADIVTFLSPTSLPESVVEGWGGEVIYR